MHDAHEVEWEMGEALREALEGMPLQPGPDRDEHLARLVPLVRGELGRLERQRGLSDGERANAEALRVLLAASKGTE